MQALWRNPELIRHARADLRPARMATAAAVSVLLCALLILMFYHPGIDKTSAPADRDLATILFISLASLQALVFCLWCLSSCGQAISSERALKTFDFLRTTRLTSWELLVGMVFGAPLMAYFTLACTLPFTLVLGLYAGFPLLALAATYLMLLLLAVVLSLAALAISMMTDRPRAGELLLLLALFGFPAWASMIGASGNSPFPGLTAILVIVGLQPLYHVAPNPYMPITQLTHVPFFSFQVPSLFVSVVLYLSVGAWLLLILLRNLKKDREDIRLLSRWQVVGFTVYLNLLLFALLDLRTIHSKSSNPADPSASDIGFAYLGLNFLILYAVGLASLTTPARLRSGWVRASSSAAFYWSEDGLPWPWMAASAIAAFLLFVLEALVARPFIPFSEWSVGGLAAGLFVLLVFAVRDVLFLQWCALRGFRSPAVKGMLFLLLYYITALAVTGFFFHSGIAWFTPLGAFGDPELGAPTSVFIGVVLQLAVSVYLSIAIRQRLAPSPSTPAASNALAS